MSVSPSLLYYATLLFYDDIICIVLQQQKTYLGTDKYCHQNISWPFNAIYKGQFELKQDNQSLDGKVMFILQ